MATRRTDNLFLLQLFVGIFFVTLGLMGILPDMQESVFSLSDGNRVLELVFGVLELVAGGVMLIGLGRFSRTQPVYTASLLVLVFWAARIVLAQFVFGLSVGNVVRFVPNFPTWLLVTSAELVILMAVRQIMKKYSR